MNTKTQHEHEEIIETVGRKFACLFRRDAAGGYFVTCPKLPPMMAYGETLDEARANAAEEIADWLDAREVADSYHLTWLR